jgi:hypothetical protein
MIEFLIAFEMGKGGILTPKQAECSFLKYTLTLACESLDPGRIGFLRCRIHLSDADGSREGACSKIGLTELDIAMDLEKCGHLFVHDVFLIEKNAISAWNSLSEPEMYNILMEHEQSHARQNQNVCRFHGSAISSKPAEFRSNRLFQKDNNNANKGSLKFCYPRRPRFHYEAEIDPMKIDPDHVIFQLAVPCPHSSHPFTPLCHG